MRVAGVERGAALTISVDGVEVESHAGETVATAMLAAGISRFRDDTGAAPRGLWCNMGSCGECTVRVGNRRVRACMTTVAPGLVVTTDG